MIKTLLVDDHDLVRHGIKTLLNDTGDIQVIGEATSGEEAIAAAKKLTPDVILMDVKMDGIGGIEAIKRINQNNPSIQIMAVSSLDQEPYPSRILQAGAAGFISKSTPAQEMIEAIKTIAKGKKHISPEIAQRIALRQIEKLNHKTIDAISEREMQILTMITMGKKVKKIAEILHLEPKTVNSYRYRIFEKLGINSDVELTHFALANNIISVMETAAEK